MKDKYRIHFNPRYVIYDKDIFTKYCQNTLTADQACRALERFVMQKVTFEKLIANVYWLGYGSLFEQHHIVGTEVEHIRETVRPSTYSQAY